MKHVNKKALNETCKQEGPECLDVNKRALNETCKQEGPE